VQNRAARFRLIPKEEERGGGKGTRDAKIRRSCKEKTPGKLPSPSKPTVAISERLESVIGAKEWGTSEEVGVAAAAAGNANRGNK